MCHHFTHCCIVRYHKTLKTPLPAQYISKQPFVCSSRYTINLIERTHNTANTCFYSSFVRGQVIFVHLYPAHIHRIVVSACFGSSIQGKMFYTSHQVCSTIIVFPLVASHH